VHVTTETKGQESVLAQQWANQSATNNNQTSQTQNDNGQSQSQPEQQQSRQQQQSSEQGQGSQQTHRFTMETPSVEAQTEEQIEAINPDVNVQNVTQSVTSRPDGLNVII